MNNHLNAIKKFFVYLNKEGIADNIFNKFADYDAFKDEIITENNLKPSSALLSPKLYQNKALKSQ